MSSELFRVARVKVRRGRKHLASIGPELEVVSAGHQRFLQAASAGILDHFTPALSIPDGALDEVACCVGDTVHNLRAALDVLACEVVALSNGSPELVDFPFALTEAKLARVLEKKNFKYARADAQRLHLSLKPHGGPSGSALLWGLHQLDVIDKHRDLLTLTTAQDRPGLYFEGVHLKPEDHDGPRLVFSKGSLFEGEEVEAKLHAMAILADEIIDKFSDLFR